MGIDVYKRQVCGVSNDQSPCYTAYVSTRICNVTFRGRGGYTVYTKNARTCFHYNNTNLCGGGIKKADGNIKNEASEKSYEYIIYTNVKKCKNY